MKWYPPAESKVPFGIIYNSLKSRKDEAEAKLCSFVGSKYCLFGSNAKTLLSLLLSELFKNTQYQKDEVLIPGYTCYSVAASVVKAGLKLRLYDLDPVSLSPVMETVEARCSEKTLAIISQHLFGLPSECDGIGTIAEAIGAYHIEDAAQGLGGSLDSRSLGTIGDFGLFSFGRGKSMPIGGGGALVSGAYNVRSMLESITQSKGYHKLITTFITQVMAQPNLYWIAELLPLGLGKTIFDPNFDTGSVSLIQKRLFEEMISDIDKFIEHRRKIALIYRQYLPSSKTISENRDGISVYCRFPIKYGRHKIVSELHRFGVRRMYPFAIQKEPSIKPFLNNDFDPTPGAVDIAENIATLPAHQGISEELAYKIAMLTNRCIEQ